MPVAGVIVNVNVLAADSSAFFATVSVGVKATILYVVPQEFLFPFLVTDDALRFEPFEKFVVRNASEGTLVEVKTEASVKAHVTVASSLV